MRACMCARQLTRPSSMTMPSTSARASGLLLWSFRRRLALPPFADISTGSATLQRSSFAVLPRRLRRSPEDAPLRPAGALVNRTSPADCTITDPRVSNCWSPMRSAPSGAPRRAGRAAGAGPGAPRLLAGHATAGAALPGTPGAWTCLPGAGPTRTRNAAAVRARASRLSRRIPARRWWHMAGGTPGRESPGVRVGGRARFRSLPAAGLPALSSVRSRQRAAQRRDSSLCVQGPRRLLSLVRHRAPCRCSRPASTRAWLSPRSRYRRRSGRMFPIRSMNASQRAWRLAFRQAAGRRLTASRVDARLAALMPANPPGRSRLPAGKT